MGDPTDGIGEVLWSPSAARLQRARMTRFLEFVAQRPGASPSDAEALYAWSIDRPEEFWSAVWDFFEVRGEKGDVMLERGETMMDARWFPQARLNFAQNLLRHGGSDPALVERPEEGRRRSLSFDELRAEVSRCQQWLLERGVGEGDRVAGYLPNRIETVVAMLAATSLGAVWSSCSPDFGVSAARDRLGQIEPKVLVAADAYVYSGRRQEVLDRGRELFASIDSVESLLLCGEGPWPETSADDGIFRWDEAVSAREAAEIEFRPLPFDHPVFVMFSSGTTGLPKGIVHGAGGTLLQHLKELALHTDLHAGERIAYYTTCGWMMWNWLVSSLSLGATVVLLDGSPFAPQPDRLLATADEEELAVLGVSAKYLALAEKRGVRARGRYDLGSLRAILSTGSPLAPDGFDYVYRDLKADLQLASISGGTDIISCFALGHPLLPVRRGELQSRGLGMKVEVHDDEGRSLPPGETGELVCTEAFPSMPVSFWNDPDRERYRRSYFEESPKVWRHGDWAEITPSGGMILHGRSDTTLNPGGVRIGTAEIYRIVETLDEVLEAVAVGQRQQDDVRVVLFVRLREGEELSEELRRRIRDRIREGASPHHAPRKIVAVDDIPRTVNGKISEIAVQRTIHGEPVKNLSALANPEALEGYRDRPELADA